MNDLPAIMTMDSGPFYLPRTLQTNVPQQKASERLQVAHLDKETVFHGHHPAMKLGGRGTWESLHHRALRKQIIKEIINIRDTHSKVVD